jgi:hypothetical protein
MSSAVILNKQFTRLPMEIVHMICLFTGKFVFDKDGMFKSIIDIREFLQIDLHLLNMIDFKIEALAMERQRLIKFLRSQTYKPLEDEERIHEEVTWLQNIDYTRHKQLFLTSSPVEEVMIPLRPGVFCEDCQMKCTSKELSYLYDWTFNFRLKQVNYYIRHFIVKENTCIRCHNYIKRIIVVEPPEENEKIKVEKKQRFLQKNKVRNNPIHKTFIPRINYKKNFRRLV